MRRFFGKKEGEKIVIEDNEFYHLKKVLRMNEGDKIIASINDEYDYYCTIYKMNKDNCLLQIDNYSICPALPKKKITLFQMIPKKDYFDQILPKSIELGVNDIYFFTSDYTMIKNFKRERVETQVMTACKQCERSKLVTVHELIDFDKMIDLLSDYDAVIFANEHEKSQKFDINWVKNIEKIAVIVGNEGGFSEKEANIIIKKGGKSFSLGKRILRCDTATTAVLSLVGIFSDN